MITFEPSEGGIEVVDAVERYRYALGTAEAVTPEPAATEGFRAPVEEAVDITTTSIALPTVVAVYARNETGAVVAEAEHFAHQELPSGTYSLEVCAPIKLYFRVESPVTITADARRTRIEFGSATTVRIGARSYHEHPAATVTTTDDPVDVMRAVSTLGSALKTTSPERSYPTLRGHPPTIELGDRLEIPEGIERPETGISIELPPEYGPIFVAAPLAYYLGAELVPGETPRIVTETGFERSLESGRGYERAVERALKQVFFLDCVTRTEGLYPVELHERRAIESRLDLDFEALYEQSIAGRLEAYLNVPFAAIEEFLPEWKLTSHIEPVATSVETLPFVVNDLAVVRTPERRSSASPTGQATAFDDFVRATDGGEGFTRSAAAQPAESQTYVQPGKAESLEQAWIGEGTPLGASKAIATAYRNRLDREPTDGAIEIAVVCNDPAMDDERADIDEVYGSRAELPFDVTVYHTCTVEELETVLTTSVDFLHYIGHIDDEGFECANGKLDAGTLETVGVDAFFLNGCTSYDQGIELIEAGAIGGVVTLDDVINSGAVRIGRAMARLLNCGFPLGAALEIARGESVVGEQYLVVGDGGVAVAQAQNGFPNLCEVERLEDHNRFRLEFKTYPTSHSGLGGMTLPSIHEVDTYSLSSGIPQSFEMTREELVQFLSLEAAPVRINGELHWPDQIDIGDL